MRRTSGCITLYAALSHIKEKKVELTFLSTDAWFETRYCCILVMVSFFGPFFFLFSLFPRLLSFSLRFAAPFVLFKTFLTQLMTSHCFCFNFSRRKHMESSILDFFHVHISDNAEVLAG